ncbi:NADPH:quinone oxidoreductase family protein [Oceanicoccus sp. KOV_DT_Chl]|uniref:NADPH:quinone oxidoreductase family protein n=1 Tax=Oceanicoccus sp. KOV_DT_Chl TaxID=1904639 RepID=UPI000C7D0BD5|nr:NADPH:quinone oxidoreductase family protein [Oceanicoccus sp. KOV_DT_Chl]
MKAIVCNTFAPLEQLQYTEVADPVAAAKEIVIAVKAAGVNYPDALIVQGLYQDKPPLPFIPGIECAGEIFAIGEQVTGFSIGTRVIGFSSNYGAYAEKVACPAHNVILIPDDLSFVDAANLACAHGTAHHALKQRGNLQAGETLLVLGAAGGTGVAAVQIGKAMGARVIAACSSADKLAIAEANGADVLINYSEQDLRTTLKEITGGKGIDVVFDPVGGEAFNACSRSMARNGRLLIIGFASGQIPQLTLNLPLVKEYSVSGVFWGSFTQHEPAVFADNMQELFQWHHDKKIHVITDGEFALSATAIALTQVMQRQVKGKLVLIP